MSKKRKDFNMTHSYSSRDVCAAKCKDEIGCAFCSLDSLESKGPRWLSSEQFINNQSIQLLEMKISLISTGRYEAEPNFGILDGVPHSKKRKCDIDRSTDSVSFIADRAPRVPCNKPLFKIPAISPCLTRFTK